MLGVFFEHLLKLILFVWGVLSLLQPRGGKRKDLFAEQKVDDEWMEISGDPG